MENRSTGSNTDDSAPPGSAARKAAEQMIRELILDEASLDETLAAFGFGVCEICGRSVDDDEYTDCVMVCEPGDPGWHVVETAGRADEARQMGVVLCNGCASEAASP